MVKQRIKTALAGLSSLVVVLLGAGAGHAYASATMMPVMSRQMPQNQCQSSCSPQNANAIVSGVTTVKDKDINPPVTEPYYLAFVGVGWSTVIILAAYLLRHLYWRPPDLFKLYSVYRI